MKKFLKCRVTIFLALFWIGLSAIGYMGKDTIYRDYTEDVRKTPYFVLVFDGIRDGIYPWELKGEELAEQPLENPDLGQLPPATEETETEDAVGTEAVPQAPETEAPEQPTEVLPPPEPLPPQTKEFIAVGDDYFDDAVFIGDSRTVGLHDYGGLDQATFFATVGLNVYDMWSQRFCEVDGEKLTLEEALSRRQGLHDYGGLDQATFFATVGLNVYDMWSQRFCEVDGEKLTLEEALSRRQYKKIYFQIGINEMGRGTVDTFMQAYEESVRKFQQLQPDAIIYVQGIMRVTKEKSDKDKIFNNPGIQVRNEAYEESVRKFQQLQPDAIIYVQGIMRVTKEKSDKDKIFNNPGIQVRNERIAQLADNVKIFYIDVNEVVCDDTGNLRKELTFDNLHLYGSKYYIWVDFLKTKGVAIE